MMDPWTIIGWLLVGCISAAIGLAAFSVVGLVVVAARTVGKSRRDARLYLESPAPGKTDWFSTRGVIYTTTPSESGDTLSVRRWKAGEESVIDILPTNIWYTKVIAENLRIQRRKY